MVPVKSSKDENNDRRPIRSKTSSKTPARAKKMPTKAVLKQMAKDWAHVT